MRTFTVDGDKAIMLRNVLDANHVYYEEKPARGKKLTFNVRCSNDQASWLEAWARDPRQRETASTRPKRSVAALRGGLGDGRLIGIEDNKVELKGESIRWSYNNSALREWVSSARRSRSGRPRSYSSGDLVGYIGNGPFDKNKLHDLLAGFISGPILAAEPSPSISVVILGREGWIPEEVYELIDERIGQALKIYSQEMYLAYLETSNDPFAARQEDLQRFKAGHPGLEVVAQGWRGWVTTQVREDWQTAGRMENEALNDRSPLHALDYKVGENGQPKTKRRQILRDAYEGPLRPVGSPSYMAKWGAPKTPKRLRKMADLIARICRNMKRKLNRSEKAIADWEEDLDWLKREFYRPHCQFRWPDTSV